MTADALLAAIRADPDADLPRLVYADHLDDAGDAARAEFIRVQRELARLPEWDDRRPALEDREHELLDAHEPAWLNGVGDRLTEWEWRGGFVDEVSGPFGALSYSGGEGFAGHPVRVVHVTGWQTDRPPPVVAEPWMTGVRELSLVGGNAGHEAVRGLGRSPYLARLAHLDVTDNPGLTRLPDALFGASYLGRLTALTVGGTGIGTVSADARRLAGVLADSPLDRLHLPNCGLDADGLGELLAGLNPCCPTALDLADNDLPESAAEAFRVLSGGALLRRLDVSGTGLGARGLDDLLTLPALDRLTHLDANRCGNPGSVLAIRHSAYWRQAEQLRLHSSDLDWATVDGLCRPGGPPNLRLLDLADNHLTDNGVAEVSDAPWVDALTWLALSRNALTDTAAVFLMGDRFRNLRTLHLAFDPLTDAAAAMLAAAPNLARLRLITLSHTRVTDRAAELLLDAPHWQLSGLGLAGCDLSGRAVHALATSPRLRRLQWLDLSGNPRLGGDTLLPLAESPHLSRLCELDIGGVDASDRVRDALRQRLGRRLSD